MRIELQLFGGRAAGSGGGGSGGGASSAADSTATAAAPPPDFPEAFRDGVDLAAAGWVNHVTRTVSNTTQKQWDEFTASYEEGMTPGDYAQIMKDWEPSSDKVFGYVRTTNSGKINKALYDPANAGKTDEEIFTRTDKYGNLRDLQTVKTLDKAINNHVTQSDASYTRFCGSDAIQATFGLSNSEIAMLASAKSMNASQLASLNSALSGKTSYSNAYTSTSANRSMNAFSNPNASQSSGWVFERKINVQKGTKAFAVRRNAQESEVIFGRKMETRLTGVSIGSDGHIVLHETFVGYK